MRTVGGSLVGETLTLERVISNYFYANSKNLSTQQMLSITACALFQTKLCGDLPKLKHTFNNFVFKINTGSSFEHVNDQSLVDESFIRGYIRYIVSNRIVKYIPNFDDELNIVVDDQSTKCMVALRKILESMDINPLKSLNSAKAITVDTVFPDKEKMKDLKVTEIEQEILAAQTKAVHKFMADVFSREYVLAGSQHVFTMALEAKQGGNENVVLQLPVNEPLLLLKNDDNNVNPLIVIQDPNQEAVKLEVGVEGNGVGNNNGKEVKIEEK
jgi:hypothetical protein